MNSENNPQGVATGERVLSDMGRSVRAKASDARDAIREESCDMCAAVKERMRENPLPFVAGAFAFGIAVGCAIMAGCHEDPHEKYVTGPLSDANDAVSDALSRLYSNLKFW
jgi:hypothetical protein